MASILPFIKKYLNSNKNKSLDKLIEELAEGFSGGIHNLNDGAVIAQGLGTFVLTEDGETFIPPENGVYRIIAVAKGGTPDGRSEDVHGACTAIVIAKLTTDDVLTVSISKSAIETFKYGINVDYNGNNIIFVPNVYVDMSSDCGKDYVFVNNANSSILSFSVYPGLSNGSVGCVIPGLMAEAYQGLPTSGDYSVVYPTGRGFAGHLGEPVLNNDTYKDYAYGARGYGAAGACNLAAGHSYRSVSEGGPAACIITLLKKE